MDGNSPEDINELITYIQQKLHEFKTDLTEFYTDDPINWIKWIAVYAVLILAYIWWIPRYNKISYRFSWERKRDIAISRNHVIQSTLVDSFRSGKDSNKMWHAKYLYVIDGEERIHRCMFNFPSVPSRTATLYYVDNPKKIFCYGEYHWEIPKGFVLVFLMFVPWYLAMVTILVLGIPLPK